MIEKYRPDQSVSAVLSRPDSPSDLSTAQPILLALEENIGALTPQLQKAAAPSRHIRG